MVDRKTHVAFLLDKLKSGEMSPHTLHGMIDAAKGRGDHEIASRMQEAFDKNIAASGTGPRGGRYKLGRHGEKIYIKKSM